MKFRLTGLIVVACVALAGCERDRAPASAAVDAAALDDAPSQPAPEAVEGVDFEPIPERLAIPTPVLAMRLKGDPVGTYVDREVPEGVPLRAVGLNLCQTGWVLQGFMEIDGELRATPPLPIDSPDLPSGKRVTQTNPRVPGQKMVLDFSEASMSRLVGSLTITGDDADTSIMKLEVDAEPVGISPGPGLGARGCFTTGYYRLEHDDASVRGPVSSVWDEEQHLYYVGMRLTEKHGVAAWLVVKPTHRQPQNIMRGDLERVSENPEAFGFRVVFETRVQTDVGFEVVETPATAGQFQAAFSRANPQGPLRIELEGLQFPQWDGPMSQRTVDLRVETLVVTDPHGSSVPVPSDPKFERRGDETQTERPNPDAPLPRSPGPAGDQK